MRLLFFLFFSFLTLSATIVVDKKETVNLLEYSKVYHDVENKETILTILEKGDKFETTKKEAIDYCNLTPEGVWIKFNLQNSTNKNIDKILRIDNLSTERVDLYKVKNKKLISQKTTGIYHLKEFDGTIALSLPISINANSIESYYLNVKNEKLSLWFKPQLYEPKEFYKEDTLKQIMWALFFGGIFSLIIYNIFLFIFTKDKIFLFYFLYLIATLMQSQFSINAKFYLFPMDNPNFVKNDFYFNVFYVNVLVSFTMTLFIRYFLNTKLYPKIDLSLKLLIFIIPIYFILQIFDIFTIPQVVLFQFFTPYYFLWIGFYALYKKNPQANFFLLGWSFALLAWLSLFFQYMGILPVEYIYGYTFETLIMAEVILFAISLAYRIKNLEKKKNDLTVELLKKEKTESRRLEKIVKIRTKELNSELKQNELLLKELHHRVKNNMQFITSLYALKLNENADKKMEENLHDVERKIHAMSIVHQMLYNQKNLESINAKEYFEKVIENIKNGFELENISFKLNINAILDIEEAIYCGLIVNELVTNAIKYAFDGRKGCISIYLNNYKKGILLEVLDNGKGLIKSDKITFGQMMVESLATEQLEGNLNIKVENGTHISLYFKNKIKKNISENNEK
ncbi:7TM diverse intracellular signaling domain-containing protein [Arcobacter sp. F155]|uniref:7TM diverse intracellular signaling domain-containing protein n=1 Tax=Arcobacter sp. F155 TaxID=2044512 RepID=UPI0013E8FCAA|nr:7TM diverse intracellular signaling domain-containing protein [Arcobacter sp. F155]